MFILTAVISLIFTPLSLTSQETLYSFFYTARFAVYLLAALVIFLNFTPGLKLQIGKILVYSGLGIAILGLLQFFFLPDLRFLESQGWDPHYFRTTSTFLDPNFAGVFFALTLILLTIRPILKMKSSIRILILALVFITLATTYSRSAYLMFLVSGLLLAYLQKSAKTAQIVVFLTAALLVNFYAYTQLISKPRNIDRTVSATSRLNTWQEGFEIFTKYPILGVGFNTYPYALQKLKLATPESEKNRGSSSNDSSLLLVLATTGVVGFIFYLWFIIELFKIGFKMPKPWAKALTVGIGGLLVASIFNNVLFYPPVLAWIILTLSQTDLDSTQ